MNSQHSDIANYNSDTLHLDNIQSSWQHSSLTAKEDEWWYAYRWDWAMSFVSYYGYTKTAKWIECYTAWSNNLLHYLNYTIPLNQWASCERLPCVWLGISVAETFGIWDTWLSGYTCSYVLSGCIQSVDLAAWRWNMWPPWLSIKFNWYSGFLRKIKVN